MATASTTSPSKEYTALKMCFSKILSNKHLILDNSVLYEMVFNELSIESDSLEKELYDILPAMLVFYIESWPGWCKYQEFCEGALNYTTWFDKFISYLSLKMNYVIKSGYQLASKDLVNRGNKCKNTQTDVFNQKNYAPFTLNINCPANMTNNIVFTSSFHEDDVLLKTHQVGLWKPISLKEMLNWPNIEISFVTPDLSFKRRNVFEYNRYLSLTNCPLKHENHEFISEIDMLDQTKPRECYTYNFFNSYINEFLYILQNIPPLLLPNSQEILSDTKEILTQFLQDINEFNINNKTMATNTKVVFNIGRRNYVRVKKLSNGLKSGRPIDIGFCEFITPRISLELDSFVAKQDKSKQNIEFTYLNIIKPLMFASKKECLAVVPVIHFICNYCSVVCTSKDEMQHHLQNVHQYVQQNVLCFKCKQSFSVNRITQQRWTHECVLNGQRNSR